MRILFVFLFVFTLLQAKASDSLSIAFTASSGKPGTKIQRNQWIKTGAHDSLRISDFRFYISNVQLLHQGKIVFTDSLEGHLINPFQAEQSKLMLSKPRLPEFDEIKLGIGIDSLTSVDGPKSNDLDPIQGMYWTWQSGYINLRIEGQHSASTLPNNEFFFHLGAYAGPFNCYQTLSFKVNAQNQLAIEINLLDWFKEAEQIKVWKIMSPRREAAQLSKTFARAFRVIQP
ncbi:MAG: hypothetical protein LCH37_07165 [Bacteroidetes bacterium]|nr:hypothetical protein [Bacteroidota bacterium]